MKLNEERILHSTLAYSSTRRLQSLGGNKSLKRSLLWHDLGHLTWDKAVEEISPKVDWPSTRASPPPWAPTPHMRKREMGRMS